MTRLIRTALAGLGAVNRNWLTLLIKKHAILSDRYDLAFQIVAITDSSGAAYCPDGFAPADLIALKMKGGRVADLATATTPHPFTDLLDRSHCDLLLEATPVNLQTGEPGLSITRAALQRGVSVVLANKGPLVLAFQGLTQLAKSTGARLAYSATVCGALPVINIGQRDLVAADLQLIRGIFNSTTNFILAEMATGTSFADALAEAQRRGIAETDPTLDIDGWDTANKLIIIANSILQLNVQLQDVAVTGIREVTSAQLLAAHAQGATIKLVATLQNDANGYQLTVAPTVVALDDFLGSCRGWEMGLEIHSDLYGRLYHKIWEDSPIPTAAAMLRDAVNLFAQGSP